MAEATEHLRIVITAQDQASAVLRGMGQQLSTAQAALAGAVGGAAMAALQIAVQKVAEAFQFAESAVIGFNATLEQSRIAWSTMLGGATQAQIMLRDLQRFAAQTPFEFPDVERAARRMVAMGFAGKDIVGLLTDIGNAASALGLGREGIDRISLALGQMSTRTKVSAEDMLQLTEVGVPAWQILADATGKSVAQVQDAASKGVIPAQTFIQAFRLFSQANYGNLMEQQSRTFSGAVSNINDNIRLLLASGFEPMFNGLRDLALAFSDFLTSEGVQNFARGLRAVQILIANTFGSLGTVLAPALQQLSSFLAWAGRNMWEGFANIAIGALNAVGEAWNTFWGQEIGATGQTAFQQLIEQAATGWAEFVDLATRAFREVAANWNALIGFLQGIRAAGVPLVGIWGAIADQTAISTQAIDDFSQTLKQVPAISIQAFQAIKKFVSEDVWQAISDAWNQAAVEIPDQAEDTGRRTGNAFGNGLVQATKPLLESLARMIAQAAAGPAKAALEDAQAIVEHSRLILADLSQPLERRQAAMQTMIQTQLFNLPRLQLEAFEANEPVRLLTRAEQEAQLRQEILKTQVALTVNVQLPDGSVATYQELVEANGQSQVPQPVQVSAVRRN